MEVVSDLMDPPAGGEREEQFLFPCGERARASPIARRDELRVSRPEAPQSCGSGAAETSVSPAPKCLIYRA